MAKARVVSAKTTLKQIIGQLDELGRAPKQSSLLDKIADEFPDLMRQISAEELHSIERRLFVGSPQGADPTTVFEELVNKLPDVFGDTKTASFVSQHLQFAIRPTPFANSQIARIDDFNFRVDVNQGMWSLLSAFQRILALSVRPDQVKNDPVILTPKARLRLLTGLVKLQIEAPAFLAEVAGRALGNNDQETFSIDAANAAKRFVVCHEMMHFFLGHLFSDADGIECTDESGQRSHSAKRQQSSDSWEKEIAADRGAFNLLITIAIADSGRLQRATRHDAERDSTIIAYLGVISALGTLLILEAGSDGLRSHTHPPADTRLREIRSHVTENYPGAAEAWFRMANAMEEFYRENAKAVAAIRME